MGNLVRGFHYTRTVRINDSFFPTWFTLFTAFSNRSTYQTRICRMENQGLFGHAKQLAQWNDFVACMREKCSVVATLSIENQQDANHFYENDAPWEHASSSRIFIGVLCDP